LRGGLRINKNEYDYESKVKYTSFKNNDAYGDDLAGGVDNTDRDRARAELERQLNEVKSATRSLMRKAPESDVIHDPLLAEKY